MLLGLGNPRLVGDPATPDMHAYGEDANGLIKGLVTGDTSLTHGRTSTATISAWEGLIKNCLANELRIKNARRGENLATGLVTETITVINGNEYQLTIDGANGDTAVCSGAFTGTLTANGTNRISWNSGVPKTAVSTSLTITVTGTLTELFLEDVTGDSDQNPGEYIPAGESDGTDFSYAGGVRYYAYEKGNSVGVTGIVTEAKGADLTTDWKALNEPAATNLMADSEDLSAGSWNKNRITITPNATVAPNGLTTAQNILSTASTNTSRALSPKSINSGAPYTYSHYVKKDGIDWVYLNALSFDVEQGCYFDLTNGVIGTSTAISEGIRDAGDGWYRCWIEFSTTIDVAGHVGINIAEADGDSILTGGGLSLFVWGAQMELGSLPTSYIPTSGGTSTRTADDGSPSFAFSNWSQIEGTLVLDLVMQSEEDQGIFNVANAEAGVLSYDSTNKFQTDDGTNTANVDPILGSNLGDTIRLCVGYKTSGSLFIGYKNVTDAGSWVWDTDSASYDGAFATNSVINLFYDLAAVSQIKNLYYYQTQQTKAFVEANY